MSAHASLAAKRNFDTLIIGGGAVGIALANRLVEMGHSICVVEAGQKTPDANYETLNGGVQSGPRKHLGLKRGRYKGLGGTTRLWGGQLMPFSATDFLPDLANNKPGWPISFAEVSSWTDEALSELGVPQAAFGIKEQWARAASTAVNFGPALQIEPSVWMKRPDFNHHFAALLNNNNSAQILTEYEAYGIALDHANGRVTGANIRHANGEEELIRARSTVIACGTLETSKLLLRAQAQHQGTPLGKNSNVGKWFIDHLHGVLGRIEANNTAKLGAIFDTVYSRPHKLTPKIRLSDEALLQNKFSNCAVTVNAAYGLGEATRELRGLARRVMGQSEVEADPPQKMLQSARILLPLAWRYVSARRSGKFLGGDVTLGVEIEQIPTEKSYIRLDQNSPPESAEIDLHWAVDGREMSAVSYIADQVQSAFKRLELGKVHLDPFVIESDPNFLEKCHDSSHQAGGARMSDTPATGVTNGNCQVFDMPGLYVAGAATFPSGSFANPTLTAIALALRLADHLESQTA